MIRTIKNGTIRCNGVTFYPWPFDAPYDGRLDGLRYHVYLSDQPYKSPTVTLVGPTDETPDDPPHVFDGEVHWLFWIPSSDYLRREALDETVNHNRRFSAAQTLKTIYGDDAIYDAMYEGTIARPAALEQE